MARIQTFRELEVWQMAMELVMDCYAITDRYPDHERYGLSSQTRRSSVSIPSNIAEGHNRHADGAYLNHVNIALGSQAEVDTQLEIAVRRGYIKASDIAPTVEKLARTAQMLHGLQRSLERRVKAPVVVTLAVLACLAAAAFLQ
jgi:four helix bundle protein